MSNPTKVQSYLNRHKIGSLFEGMMGKLVKDMPADPLEYLTQLIQEKKEKRKSSPTAGPEMSEGKLGASSAWASETKEYEKPWRARSKKPKPSSPEGNPGKDWDKTVKLTSKSFDEMTLNKQAAKSKKASDSFQRGEMDFFSADAEDCRGCSMTEEELLLGEVPTHVKVTRTEANKVSEASARNHPKLKGPKADSTRHSQELKAFLQDKRAEKEDKDSGVGSVSSDDESNVGAGVLAEDVADLADEGVMSSSTVKQVRKAVKSSAADPMIHMSICSKCAKVVLKDGQESDTSVSDSSTSVSTRQSKKKVKGESTSRSDQWATHRTDTKTSPQRNPTIDTSKSISKGGFQQLATQKTTARTDLPTTQRTPSRKDLPTTQRTGYSSYYSDDDDEFESVSQISGEQPRIPMWTASDDEDLTPVKGSSMLTSPRIAAKPTSSQRKTVTLKEDLLRGLPQSTNSVRDFIGSNTWSGDKMATEGMRDVSRRSYDSTTASRKPHDVGVTRKSYDPLSSKNTAGWKFDVVSDDDSTLIYK